MSCYINIYRLKDEIVIFAEKQNKQKRTNSFQDCILPSYSRLKQGLIKYEYMTFLYVFKRFVNKQWQREFYISATIMVHKNAILIKIISSLLTFINLLIYLQV